MKNFIRYYKDKNILITGGASGLGKEMIKDLFPIAKSIHSLDIIEDSSEIDNIYHYQIDLRDTDKSLSLFEEIDSKYPIDIVIANAGTTSVTPISITNLKSNKDIFKLNYFGATDILTYFTSMFKKRGSGHLVAISSIGIGRGIPTTSAYFSAKTALTVFMEALRNELSNEDEIFTTTIHPGFIKTKMATEEKIKHSFEMSVEKASKKTLKAIAKKRSDFRFPYQMRVLTFINRLLPNKFYDLTLKATTKD